MNMHEKTLVNVLGIVYTHLKSYDGGDLYLTPYAQKYHRILDTRNWFDRDWFLTNRVKLKGTSSVYKVPTREVDGKNLDLVVKYCRVGEDVPLDTHTLEEFCDAEFNSPWEEFSLVMEMEDGLYSMSNLKIRTQHPMGIYVPPEKMQAWQSGRSRSKINRIRAKHPGIDLDILKQYLLIYQWIDGDNLREVFEHLHLSDDLRSHYLEALDGIAVSDLKKKGYLVADAKPEHIIIDEKDVHFIKEMGISGDGSAKKQLSHLFNIMNLRKYAIVDYELLLRTPDHEATVKNSKRHSYLDAQRDRFIPTPLPSHLTRLEIFQVPYIFGHAESTGGNLWVVGNNSRLFDYFLPERWRKTPSIILSQSKEVFYTLTKDNIHLVWETSSVGEIPDRYDDVSRRMIMERGINSPFEEFSISYTLNQLGIHCAYARAIYMTGTRKMEVSSDRRRYESHRDLLDPEGNPILQEDHNYITIRGYYNGPDTWVADQEGPLYTPVDFLKAMKKGFINEPLCQTLLAHVQGKLRDVGYDGSLLKPDDLLLCIDNGNKIVREESGRPLIVICNFENIWKR